LQLLRDIKTVPLHGGAVGSIFLGVGTANVNLFLGAREWSDLQGSQSDVLRAGQKHIQVLLSEFGVVVDDLGEVNQTDFSRGFRASLFEDCVDDVEEDRSILINSFGVNILSLDSAGSLEVTSLSLALVLTDHGGLGSN